MEIDGSEPRCVGSSESSTTCLFVLLLFFVVCLNRDVLMTDIFKSNCDDSSNHLLFPPSFANDKKQYIGEDNVGIFATGYGIFRSFFKYKSVTISSTMINFHKLIF